MKKINLEPHTINNIIGMYKSGISCPKIGKQLGYSSGFIRELIDNDIKLRKYHEINRKYNNVKSSYFSNIETEARAYILGFLFADGNIDANGNAITLKLQIKDIDILKRISFEIVGEDAVIINKYDGAYLLINDPIMKSDLIKLGCIPKKSLKLEFPNIKDYLLPHFMRGYFDGDGCLTKYKDDYRWSIISTENFCIEYGKILEERCNVNLFLTKEKESVNRGNLITSSLSTGGNQKILKICNWLYANSTWFLTRKYEKFVQLKELLNDRKAIQLNIENMIISSYNSGKSVEEIHKELKKSRTLIYKLIKTQSLYNKAS